MKQNPQPPRSVPVLTEVVDLGAVESADADPAYAVTAPAPLGVEWPEIERRATPPQPAAAVDEDLLAQRVLAALDKQVDLMFEHRLRETLSPVLTRMTDTLVREMRNQLASTLREMVIRAVSAELSRQKAP